MGQVVTQFYINTFNNGFMVPKFNNTYLFRISKCSNASNLKNFRPIGLCNIQYKIVTKIIVRRLRPFLFDLIGPSQANFLPIKRTSDNVIIV